MGLTKDPSESGSNSNDRKKTFLLEVMRHCENEKTSLKSSIERNLSVAAPLHVRNEMIEKTVDESFRNLSKFLVSSIRKQFDSLQRGMSSIEEDHSERSQETIRRLQTDLEIESSALKEANATLARQADELEHLNAQLKQLQMKIIPIERAEPEGLQEKINELQKELEAERSALKGANLSLEEAERAFNKQADELKHLNAQLKQLQMKIMPTERAEPEGLQEKINQLQKELEAERSALRDQTKELVRLQHISKDYDETQLWLTQILGDSDAKGDLKNQVRDLVKTIIESSKRLSRYKSQEEQTKHDLESYQRMFVIVDLLSNEDSTVRALRILSEREKMSVKELADATGQNSLVLKMKLRRFSRSGAIKLDDEGNVQFTLKIGEVPNG
ncbi:MAG: hypothetical protein ACFFB3_01100 [Candidatus Hodarchaeota archaeon]